MKKALRRVPERQCVACRTLRPRDQLFRLVRLADGEVVLDNESRQHGRGAYVCQVRTCIDQAIRRGAFAKALRHRVPEELMKDVQAMGH